MRAIPTPSQSRLRELLDYDPLTGILTWKKSGKKAGTPSTRGYVRLRIDGRLYLVHRLIWKWMLGTEAPNEVDHRNGKPGDNRWSELRAANRSQQSCNSTLRHSNKTGYKGVGEVTSRNGSVHYHTRIIVNGRQVYVGRFKTPQEAHAAYCAAADKYYGEFSRHA